MNVLMWIVQSILAFLCLAGGAYKILAFEELAKMPATADLARLGWTTLGVVELVCGALLIIPSALKWGASKRTPMHFPVRLAQIH